MRTFLSLDDHLGAHYGFYLGEAACFCLYAQRKLFHHLMAALYCFFGLIATFRRTGFLPFSDSWMTLLLDVPRVMLVFFLLNCAHRFLRFCSVKFCGIRDKWDANARLAELRVAEYHNKSGDMSKAIESLIQTARKLELDRKWEYLLISPRYIWNGFPFTKIRNGPLGRAYLLTLWLVYVCPLFLRMALLLCRLDVDQAGDLVLVYICNQHVGATRQLTSLFFCVFVIILTCVGVPTFVYGKTKESRYY